VKKKTHSISTLLNEIKSLENQHRMDQHSYQEMVIAYEKLAQSYREIQISRCAIEREASELKTRLNASVLLVGRGQAALFQLIDKMPGSTNQG
jgi:hypothetical protein